MTCNCICHGTSYDFLALHLRQCFFFYLCRVLLYWRFPWTWSLHFLFAPMCFLWNNLWSGCRYVMGPFSGWLGGGGGGGLWYLTTSLWKCVRNRWSPIHIFVDLLPNYTLYTNLAMLSIEYLLRCDKPSNVQFMKSWEKYVASFGAGFNTR